MNRFLSRATLALTGAALALGAGPAHAQPAPPALPNASQDAAIMCFYAAVLAGKAQTEAVAEATWFLFDAARQATADKPEAFIEKIEELAGATPPNLETLVTDAPALLPQCASRYPLISSKRTVTLPADEFTRGITCFALTGYMVGMVESDLETSSNSPFGQRMSALYTRLAAKLPPERIAEAGYADEAAAQRLINNSLRDISPMGNIMNVLKACEASKDW